MTHRTDMTPGLPVEGLVRQPAPGANELIRGYPTAGVRSTAYSEAVVTPVRPQTSRRAWAARPRARMFSARRRTPPPRHPRRSRGEGTRSRRSGAHWVPGLKTGTTLGRSTLPPNRNPRPESALRALAPATTSASAGSGHPPAPQTRKPRYSAVSQALSRTRTGDPFLTMAVWRACARPRRRPETLQTG